MSKTLNNQLCRLKVLEVQLRGIATQGRLAPADQRTYCRAIILQVAVFSDLSLGYSFNWGAWCRWARFLASIDPLALGQTIKDLQVWTRNYVPGMDTSYETFKQSQSLPSVVGAFLAPIKRTFQEFLAVPTPGNFDSVNLFLSFLSRLNLPSIDLKDQAVRSWEEDEARLRTIPLDSVTTSLNRIIKEWMEGWAPPEPWEFHHGPGGTAEIARHRSCVQAKQPLLRADALLRYCGVDDWKPGRIDRTNKIVFVAKSLTSWRTISMEPTSLQCFQQGVWAALDRQISHHPYLRRRVHLHDQSYNRRLAQLGSGDPSSFATVDLSAASDTVSWNLVKAVFRGTPVLRYLWASRSPVSRLPGGRRVELAKFAPMGSAVCFPVECLVFAACCEHVKRSWADTRDYLVFGDDIVVPCEWTQELYPLLERLGFRINKLKSFRSANLPFRESCGGEYYYGSDVTPVRLPRKFSCWTQAEIMSSATAFSQSVELCNTFYQRGWRTARAFVLAELLALPAAFRPIFDDGSKGIASSMPTNHHLISWYDESYQGTMVTHGAVRSRKEPGPDDLRYYEDRRSSVRATDGHPLDYLERQPSRTLVGASEVSVAPRNSRLF